MRRFRFVAVLLSLALLTSLVLTISGAPPVEAGGDIESEFNLVENLAFTPPTSASGTGEFELDGDLDDLEFELEIEAEGLLPNTPYDLTVSLRSGHGGSQPALNVVVVGTATTDDEGRLEFEGEAQFDETLFADAVPGSLWRFDQQIRGAGGGGTIPGSCVNCILVCSPTTLVELVDGELIPFGDDD